MSRKIRFLASEIDSEAPRIWAELTRTGRFTDPRYGEFEISRKMLDEMLENFRANTYGQEIFIDVAHKPQDGAAAKLLDLRMECAGTECRLLGELEFTVFGKDAVQQRGFSYISVEYSEDFVDNESGARHGATLLGAGLTLRPVVKNLKAISLAEGDVNGDVPLLINVPIAAYIKDDEAMNEIDKLKEKLRKDLGNLGLYKQLIETFLNLFHQQAMQLPEQTYDTLQPIADQVYDSAKLSLQEIEAGKTNITLSMPEYKIPDIGKMIHAEFAKTEQARAEAKRLTEESTSRKLAEFTRNIEAVEGFDAALKETLLQAGALITDAMTEQQIKALAEQQIRIGKELMQSRVDAKLAGMGYQASGNVHVSGGEPNNQIKELQEQFDKRLGFTDNQRRFHATGGQLQGVNKKLAEEVLERFDREHAPRLLRESAAWKQKFQGHRALSEGERHMLLAAGTELVTDISVPVIYERTVIREALYQLVALNFVNTGTVPM
ncbi:MAG TPA: hypothetical protein DIC36_00960, partial [Gammaproteobacteria bacterium]|nr:hypothetical protein [Gammaproteobacteria bacterium]